MPNKKRKRYDVLSPDGVSIHHENTYPSKKAARAAFEEWKKNYEHQGYYSYRGERIPLKYLHEYCSLIEV